MILSGEKKEEYREETPYWKARLITKNEGTFPKGFEPTGKYDALEFINGYGKKAPRIFAEPNGLRHAWGREKWGAPDYRAYCIGIGKIIKTENL